jgi:hypothetical protein
MAKKAVPLTDASTKDVQMPPSLHLDHEALASLGLHTGKMPSPGDKLKLSATAHVKNVGESDSGRHMSVELHDMAAAGGKNDNDGDEQVAKGMKGAMDKALKAPASSKPKRA